MITYKVQKTRNPKFPDTPSFRVFLFALGIGLRILSKVAKNTLGLWYIQEIMYFCNGF